MSHIDTIKKILTNNPITIEELNVFLDEYIVNQLKRVANPQQLEAITQLIQQGIFDLKYAATQSAILANLNIVNIHDVEGNIINTDVYEEIINN